jgi:DnaJ-class molecular chaperone
VKKSYKKLSLVYHPDKTSGLSEDQKEEYAAIFIELKNAYLTLGDNPTRRQYDRERDRDKASFEVNGFKPKVRPHFDASAVLKKLQEMQRPPGKQVDIPVATKLEKFYYGGHKAIKRQKKVKDFGGFKHEIRIYRCDIPKGAK